jgi:hypothetical protein
VHPDFRPRELAGGSASLTPARDAAVDYVDPVSLLDRIQASFFANAD